MRCSWGVTFHILLALMMNSLHNHLQHDHQSDPLAFGLMAKNYFKHPKLFQIGAISLSHEPCVQLKLQNPTWSHLT
jgi:hypothetical protein